jgi:hypothetical protein
MEQPEILWINVRHRLDAWKHVVFSVDGKADTAMCFICGATVTAEQGGRPIASLGLELARKHFYKHRLGTALPDTGESLPDVVRDLFDHPVIAVDGPKVGEAGPRHVRVPITPAKNLTLAVHDSLDMVTVDDG